MQNADVREEGEEKQQSRFSSCHSAPGGFFFSFSSRNISQFLLLLRLLAALESCRSHKSWGLCSVVNANRRLWVEVFQLISDWTALCHVQLSVYFFLSENDSTLTVTFAQFAPCQHPCDWRIPTPFRATAIKCHRRNSRSPDYTLHWREQPSIVSWRP